MSQSQAARPGLEALEDRLVLTAGIDSNLAYIQELYQGYLGRTGSTEELQSWQPTLITKGMGAVVASFSTAQESHHHAVRGYYQKFLGRLPQNGEELGLVKAMNEGARDDAIAATFLGSAEFYQRAPQVADMKEAPSDKALIRALFRVLLNREAGTEEISNFQRNILPRTSRPGAALFIMTSPEFRGLTVRKLYGSEPGSGVLERTTTPAPDEVGHWSQSGLRLDDIQDMFYASIEKYHNTREQGDLNQVYVAGIYQDLLGRDASQAERELWEDRLIERGMSSVVAGVQQSREARTYLVKQWYSAFLGREARGGEERSFVTMLEQGVPAESVLGILIGSPEYFNGSAARVGASGSSTPETYVRSLFRDLLGRDPSTSELDEFTKRHIPGRGRQGAAILALNTPEFRAAVISGFYDGYLARNGRATQPEVQSWVGSRQNLLVIEAAFLGSVERFQVEAAFSAPR